MCAGRPRIRIGSPFRCTHVLRLKLRRRTRGTIGRIQRFAAGFNWARGEDIYRRDDRSISGTRARWRLLADRLVEGGARGVPFPVMSAPTADVVICGAGIAGVAAAYHLAVRRGVTDVVLDRKSTRLNSSHLVISYAVFCLKKKKNNSMPYLLHKSRMPTH